MRENIKLTRTKSIDRDQSIDQIDWQRKDGRSFDPHHAGSGSDLRQSDHYKSREDRSQ